MRGRMHWYCLLLLQLVLFWALLNRSIASRKVATPMDEPRTVAAEDRSARTQGCLKLCSHSALLCSEGPAAALLVAAVHALHQ